MFFAPKYESYGEGSFRFGKNTEIRIPKYECSEYIAKSLNASFAKAIESCAQECKLVEFSTPIPEELAKEVGALGNCEEFVIVFGEKTRVYAKENRGFILAMTSLLEISERDNVVNDGVIYDYPMANIRGYRAFVPGRDQINDFIATLDFLVRYRYTSIVLEIGGAMQYERHPEINEKWIEYCRDVKRYSGRSHEIQANTYPWKKNSIHADNGNGGYLTKDECRMLVAECRARGIEIIPECPTLSHCDYIVMAHPEIRERSNDLHADTYCPKHPDTYKIVFDVLDEVIEVFEPKSVNIGHDELYSVGICERCQGEIPWKLFVEDVKKLSDYLASHGVGTYMWGDKVLDARIGGKPYGGAEFTANCLGTEITVPPIHPSVDYMPKGITYMHWYWSHGYDDVFINHGYPFVYGNLNHFWWHFSDWKKRIRAGALGGFVSNWGSSADIYMQRNSMYAELVGCAHALYSEDYDGDKYMLAGLVMKELFAYRREQKTGKALISVVHSANVRIPYVRCFDGIFIEDKTSLLGHYKVNYEDGTEAMLPVRFGINIGYSGLSLKDITDYNKTVTRLEIGEYIQLACTTYPLHTDSCVYYLCEYENPHPESKIVSLEYIPIIKNAEVKYSLVDYCKDPEAHLPAAEALGAHEWVKEYTSDEWGRDRDMFLDE